MMVLLTLAAVVLCAVSGVPGLLFSRRSGAGERIALALLAAGSACGLVVAVETAVSGRTRLASLPWAIPGGELAVRLDPLAAIFLVQIFVIAPLAAAYGLAYWAQKDHPMNGRKLRLFFGLLVASMVVLVVAHNSILFLMGWEGMALAAFVVVTTDDTDPAVRESGFVYLVATRIGTLCLFAMFATLRIATGAWMFGATTPIGASFATAIFLLGLVGCLLKAGAMPMHVWLPGAHANAPSHVSAVMSGVLIKMGIYGLVRITSLFPHPPSWWGITIFVLGGVSGVLGVAFALGQHDLKRLLAYHSVENIGIILMGLGLAVIGRTFGAPTLVALGLAGALLHVWNHGLFKALLFLSAGSVVHATSTREIDALGGLAKKMPKTALAFLIGSIAICGLPPFNGFVSELFVYVGLFHATLTNAPDALLAGAFGVPVLALIGALALACFTKVFGAVFLGSARSERPAGAHEAGRSMTAPMYALGALCLAIGVAPALVAPVLSHATTTWAPDLALVPVDEVAPLRWLSVTGFGLVVLVGAAALFFARVSRAPAGAVPEPAPVTWDCGYAAPTSRMQYTASSFAEMLIGLFSWALHPREHEAHVKTLFPTPTRYHADVPDIVLDRGVLPATHHVGRALVWFRWIQHGHIHLYLLYILAALILTILVLR